MAWFRRQILANFEFTIEDMDAVLSSVKAVFRLKAAGWAINRQRKPGLSTFECWQ
jgi:hypothetical protein